MVHQNFINRALRQLFEHKQVRPHREVPREKILAAPRENAKDKLQPHWADAVLVLYSTCMRYGSLTRLNASQVDASRSVVRDPRPKGKRAVEVTVSAEAVAAALRCCERTYPDDNAQQLDRRLRFACDKAGVERFTAHDLRVSAATHMHRDGVPLRDLQLLLGHAELRTTERYVRAGIGVSRGPVLDAAPAEKPSQSAGAEELNRVPTR